MIHIEDLWLAIFFILVLCTLFSLMSFRISLFKRYFSFSPLFLWGYIYNINLVSLSYIFLILF